MAGDLRRFLHNIRDQARDGGSSFYVKKAVPYVMRYLLAPFLSCYYASKFRERVAEDQAIEEAVETAFTFKSLGFPLRIDQIREEVAEMLRKASLVNPRLVLEIGTAGGGTLFLFSRISARDAEIISVDLPGGLYGFGYPVWKTPLLKAFAREGQKINLVRSDSHSSDTVERIKQILNGRMVDLLFIDGDHSYDGVKKDFEMYGPLVRKGGFVAIHDIVEHDPESGCEVERFWREIKGNYDHTEFVSQRELRWGGIGVLYA